MKHFLSSFVFLGICNFGCFAGAAEVTIVAGQVTGTCQSNDHDLLKAARGNARVLAGDGYFLVSRWHERVSTVEALEAPGFCLSRRAWAEGLYVKGAEISQPRYLTVSADMANPRNDWNRPGDDKLSDTQAWQAAHNEALKRARVFCNGIEEPMILEQKSDLFPWKSWYDNFTVKVRVKCL